jgi:hypothetical protein
VCQGSTATGSGSLSWTHWQDPRRRAELDQKRALNLNHRLSKLQVEEVGVAQSTSMLPIFIWREWGLGGGGARLRWAPGGGWGLLEPGPQRGLEAQA